MRHPGLNAICDDAWDDIWSVYGPALRTIHVSFCTNLNTMSTFVARVSRLNARPAPYGDVLKLQEHLHSSLKMHGSGAQARERDTALNGGSPTDDARPVPDYVLTLQHAHTYTVGKRGRDEDFKHTVEELGALLRGTPDIVRVPRGGETTYHGPGQLVVYPIVNLRRLRLGARAFVESLEDAMIATAAEYGVTARGRVPGKTGVWVGDRKIGAIGVAISGGVSWHGLAFNVSPDLTAFDHIVACGDEVASVTSLERECRREVDLVDAGVRLRSRVVHQLWRHVGGESGVRVEEVGDVWDVMRELGIGGNDEHDEKNERMTT